MSKSKPDMNLVAQETPLLKQVIGTLLGAQIKSGLNPSWWHYSRSEGWESISKGMNEENRLKFEMYWRALYRRGFLTELLGQKFHEEYSNTFELAGVVAFGTMVWVKRQMARDNPARYGAFQINPMSFGIPSEEKAAGIIVRVEAWELGEYVKGETLIVRVDGKTAHTRSEFDRDITDIADVIKAGNWPGADIVRQNGELHTKACRDHRTPGIVIGSRDGRTAYQRQPNGSLRRITAKSHEE